LPSEEVHREQAPPDAGLVLRRLIPIAVVTMMVMMPVMPAAFATFTAL
jgi:hypothetical protein